MIRGETLALSARAQKKPKDLWINEVTGESVQTKTAQAKERGRVRTHTAPETSNTLPAKLLQPVGKRKRKGS